MELVKDAHSDLMESFPGAPTSGYCVPGIRRRYYDISLLHLGGLLSKTLRWIDQSYLKT